MTCRTEVRIIEERYGDGAAKVLAPATAEELFDTPQACADQHLFAELQGRWVQQRPLPYRVEVRVWEGQPYGPATAMSAWDEDHGFLMTTPSAG